MKSKQTKSNRSKKEAILHLERSIRRFGDSDGTRKAALEKLKKESK
jgi:hypothetical protein